MESVISEEGGSIGADGGVKREQGASLLRQGRFAEAATSLAEATTADPSDETSWRLLGGAFASQGDYSRAASAFERAIALAPSNARNHYNLGLALEALERNEESRASFEQALRIDPTYSAAQTRLEALGGRPFDALPLDATLIAEPSAQPQYATTYFREAEQQNATPVVVPEPPSRYADDTHYPTVSNVGFAAEPAISATPLSPQAGVPQPVLGDFNDDSANNSGMRQGAPPSVAGGWNWGAFYLSWIWLINHKLVGWGVGLLVVSCIPYVSIVCLPAVIYLGIKGNELGWSNRRFQSVQDFKACQTIWAKWSLGVFLASLALSIIFGILYVFVIMALIANSAKHTPVG